MNLLFVSLSDLHLGEEDSLLTNLAIGKPEPEPQAPAPCLIALINYLHAIKRWVNEGRPIPFLVLNGDVLELALADYASAVAVLRGFLFELAKRRICEKIVYVPGNHDHALWSLIRDTAFMQSMSRQQEIPKRPAVDHVTRLSVPRQTEVLGLISSNFPLQVQPLPVSVANPALRLTSWNGHDYFFHHGHLMEEMYTLMSLLSDRIMSDMPLEELRKLPLTDNLADLERENWPWIDFFWSGFSRAGRVGQTVESLYELLSKPEGVKKLVERLSGILRTELDIPIIPEGFEDDCLRYVLKKSLHGGGVGSQERADASRSPLNERIATSVDRFLTHYLKRELADEGQRLSADRSAFVFGHTHKPFLDALRDTPGGLKKIDLINSGGWVVESEESRPGYGPGVVLGTNQGETALVTFQLDVEAGSEVRQTGSWDVTLAKVQERDELARAVSEAVRVRREHFRQRVTRASRLLESLDT